MTQHQHTSGDDPEIVKLCKIVKLCNIVVIGTRQADVENILLENEMLANSLDLIVNVDKYQYIFSSRR